jgi:hypothetical protein
MSEPRHEEELAVFSDTPEHKADLIITNQKDAKQNKPASTVEQGTKATSEPHHPGADPTVKEGPYSYQDDVATTDGGDADHHTSAPTVDSFGNLQNCHWGVRIMREQRELKEVERQERAERKRLASLDRAKNAQVGREVDKYDELVVRAS